MYPVSDRFAAARTASHIGKTRIEVWVNGRQDGELSENDVISGEVTGQRRSGIRKTLTMTVPPIRQWRSWLQQPMLQLRPFRGIQLRRGQIEWCPLGRFPVLPPMVVPGYTGDLQFQCQDLWSWVVADTFSRPVASYSGSLLAAAARLIDEVNVGQPTKILASNTGGSVPAAVWDKTRHDHIVELLRGIPAEAFIDRAGVPIIQDRATSGAATSIAAAGVNLLSIPEVDPGWADVVNEVRVGSSEYGSTIVSLPASITWPGHPAYAGRVGRRVAPLIKVDGLIDEVHALQVANAELDKLSGLAMTKTFERISDPSTDEGDFISVLSTVDGVPSIEQIQTITHPLTSDGVQRITTVSRRQGDSDD